MSTLEVETLLDQKQFSQAQRQNLIRVVQNAAETREKAHFQARILFREGKYTRALEEFLKIEEVHGPYIRILTNIVMCRYQLGQMRAWNEAVESLLIRYQNVEEKLNTDTRHWVELNIAKNLEELGDVEKALSFYLRADCDQAKPNWRIRAQILRIYSEFGSIPEARILFELLATLEIKEPSQYAGFEIQHALMIASSHLIGPQDSGARLAAILANPDFDLQEKTLAQFDFIENEFNLGRTPEKICLDPSSPYESFLHRHCVKGSIFQASDLLELHSLMRSSPRASLLRCLGIVKRQTESSELALELDRLFQLACGALSKESLFRWSKKLHSLQEPAQLVIEGPVVRAKNRQLDLSRYPSLLAFMNMFVENAVVPHEDAAKELWNCELRLAHYDRIRLATYRINKLLATLIDGEALFKISKTETRSRLPIVAGQNSPNKVFPQLSD